ncbi:hypothetical protein BKA80DRAFT_277423 [Phyllosticta citrichinensis]
MIAILFLVYAGLAAGTPFAAGGEDVAAAAPEDKGGVACGDRGSDILLKPDGRMLFLFLGVRGQKTGQEEGDESKGKGKGKGVAVR